MTIKLTRTHPGGYKTKLNRIEVEIERQWHSGTWVAQSVEPMANGEYFDMECETLRWIRHDLEVHAAIRTMEAK